MHLPAPTPTTHPHHITNPPAHVTYLQAGDDAVALRAGGDASVPAQLAPVPLHALHQHVAVGQEGDGTCGKGRGQRRERGGWVGGWVEGVGAGGGWELWAAREGKGGGCLGKGVERDVPCSKRGEGGLVWTADEDQALHVAAVAWRCMMAEELCRTGARPGTC